MQIPVIQTQEAPAMPKNIVICCDGTGNEFGAANSNVVKLYRMLQQGAGQVTYYHPGVGTMGAKSALTRMGKWWTNLIGKAFGYGLSDNIADAYQFLMRTYKSGDRIYVFGFSRGAYTARALCGVLHSLGLLTEGNEGLIPYAIRLIRKRKLTNEDFKIAGEFKETFSVECPVHFVGVWDTVSSVGWVYNAVRFPFTAKNPGLKIIRHAISIDERRAFFRQNLFVQATQQQDLEQVWFPGVHSDVGGSYPEAESQLSKGALKWMVAKAEAAQLLVDTKVRDEVLGGKPPYVAPDATTKYIHKSLKGFWWIAEFWPKIVHIKIGEEWWPIFRLNLARRRRPIEAGSQVHISVEQRMQARPEYRPGNLCSLEELQTKYKVVGDQPLAQAVVSK
jgi:uncharacterized protein (DUF2235 family)